MAIIEINFVNFRNLAENKTELHPHINFIHGQNGSGKTSFLETLYLLGMGHSFRTRTNQNIIAHQQERTIIGGKIITPQQSKLWVALEKTTRGKTKIQIENEKCVSAGKLLDLLPIQIISADSYFLINAGPMHRRRFMDWGVFHVEPRFYPLWKRYNRALKQRNALLKSKMVTAELTAWEYELIETGVGIDKIRRTYLDLFKPIFQEVLQSFLTVDQADFSYKPGWDEEKSLETAMKDSRLRDFAQGSTCSGPHRADLFLSCKGGEVSQILSRGQQKLFVCALYIAQNRCLRKISNKRATYLIDDLAAELDSLNISRLVSTLLKEEAQLFLTCINPSEIADEIQAHKSKKMFHMEHGLIKEVV